MKKNIVKQLKKEIKHYRKNEKAMLDVIALYTSIQRNRTLATLSASVLVEKVISDLEDPEVKAVYKNESIYNILKKMRFDFYEIIEKYKDFDECREYCNMLKETYLVDIAYYDLNNLYERNNNKKFNLITEIARYSYPWVWEFLASDIPYEVRKDMFADIMKEIQLFSDFFAYKGDFKRTSKEKVNQVRETLVRDFQDGNCAEYDLSKMFFDLQTKKGLSIIKFLQDNPFDFNSFFKRIEFETENEDSIIISAPAILIAREVPVNDIREVYECETYLNVPDVIRNNNDIFILSALDVADLAQFISYTNFRFTQEKIDLLAKRCYEYQKKNYSEASNLEEFIQKIEQVRKKIYETIILKGKDKEELMQEYAHLFMMKSHFEIVPPGEKEVSQTGHVLRFANNDDFRKA